MSTPHAVHTCQLRALGGETDVPGTRSCKLLAQHPAMLTLLAACEQVQRRLFGEDLWRRFRIPPFLGRLLGRWEATMWRWRRGAANDRFQVQLGLQACSACRLATNRLCPDDCRPKYRPQAATAGVWQHLTGGAWTAPLPRATGACTWLAFR